MTTPLTLLASLIAARAHAGQHRRDGVTPYITHPAAVASRLERTGADDVVIATAWLHDVIEDGAETPETLRTAGVPEKVVQAVEVLTKRPGVSYEDYLRGVKRHAIARQVKVADMLHNLGDNPTEGQVIKYAKGLLVLCEKGTP